MLTFIQKVYKNQKKQYHFLLAILTILAAFEFCFLSMYDSFSYLSVSAYESLALNVLPCLPAFIALTLSLFVTKYFVVSKKQEFSILLLSGRKPKDLFIYLIIQFGILAIVSYLIGIPLGMGLIAIINMIVRTSYSFELTYHLSTVCFYAFWFLCFDIILILAVSANQFVALDNDIAKNISHKETMSTPAYKIKMSSIHQKKIPYLSILTALVFLFITIKCIIELLNPKITTIQLVFSFTYALGGMIFIVNMALPLFYDAFHNSFLLKHPLLMNTLAFLVDYSKTMSTLINMNAILIPTMLFLLFFSTAFDFTTIIMVICFMMTIIMICLCFILRFSIYNQKLMHSYSILHSLGYSQKRLQKISSLKNFIFFILSIGIPFAFLSELLYKEYIEGMITLTILILLVSTYLIIYSSMILYTTYQEKQSQKEAF